MSFSGFQRALANQSNDLSGTQRSLGLGGIIPATATLTYTEITAALTQDKTATVSGASLGDLVLASPTTALAAGYMVTAFVSAANTVTVRLANNTAGALTPGALVFNILVIKL